MDFREIVKMVVAGQIKEYEACSTPVVCENYSESRLMVPMRDGIKLETYIFLPDMGLDKYPVILNRTCYPMWDEQHKVHGRELARRGYGFVYQYCRGQHGSEGEWRPNVDERNDGIDTVNWLAEQAFAGRIGVWGRSYEALVGWAMADAVTGKVSSMFLGAYGTDRFASAYEKGSFRHDVLTSWTMENAGFPITADYEASCLYRPQAEVDEALWGQKIDWYRDYILNDRLTDEYWQSGFWKQLREIPGQCRIPLMITSGWYDHHHGSSMKTWERLNPESKAHSWLEVCSLNHFQNPCLEDRKPLHDQKNEINQLFEWFDLTLKQGKLPEQRTRYYEIGADVWYESPEAEPTSMYLAVNPDGTRALASAPSTFEGKTSYLYDPEHPVRSHGAEAMLHTGAEIGSLKQPGPDYRDDVISFVSVPLEEDLDIFGKIKITLYVQSDAEDTALTGKFIDVFPDGSSYNIRSSITTIASDCPNYVPGKAVQVEIDMWDIFYQVKAGHSLRLDISSSDFPQYNIHSNYKGCWALQEKTKKAVQTILCGGNYPSSITIPKAKL